MNYFDDALATVNPEQLHKDTDALLEDLAMSSVSCSQLYNALNAHDSGVDLRGQWSVPPTIKHESSESYDHFLTMGDSPMADSPMDDSPVATNTPSPATDMIFSQSNSPGDLVRDHSSVSSPEGADLWTIGPDAILIPQPREVPRVTLVADKKKTRAETQIKMSLTLDPLDNVEYIRFPRKALAKAKHYASDEEKEDIASKGGAVLEMDIHLVCATAVEAPEDRQRALRRAAGTEPMPRRPEGCTSVSELDKADPSHPQNGGEVVICEGCKERERKRYDRKKKRTEDEEEFFRREKDRVVMINDKEYKKLQDVEKGDSQCSPRARKVDFPMRIACYCRHQEEKTPVGYRVILTFTVAGSLLEQHISDVFLITDDHKNKEISMQALPQPLVIPQYGGLHSYSYSQPTNVVVPMYQYTENYGMSAFSQPTTPAYTQPPAHAYSQPTTHAYSQPTTPAYSQPTTPAYSQPTTPGAYSQPTTPGWTGMGMGWDTMNWGGTL